MKDPLQTQQTPYEVLGIERDAGDSEIIGAFKKGMLNPRRMQEITRANRLLMDPVSRAGVDLFLYQDKTLENLTPSPIGNEKILEPGNRLSTASAWERSLAKNVSNYSLLHCVALLWFRWARYEQERIDAMLTHARQLKIDPKNISNKVELLCAIGEAEGVEIDPENAEGCPESFQWRNDCIPGVPSIEELWKATIGFWVMLANSAPFWETFTRLNNSQRKELHKNNGIDMLKSSLQKYNNEYRNRGAISMAAAYKELNLSLSVEQKTARAMSSAGVRVGTGATLSCGVLALERLGLIDQIRSRLDGALEHHPDNDTLRSLRDSLSPYSRIATLIDDGKYEEALEIIAGEKKSDEISALKAQALFGLGMDLESAGEPEEALKTWGKALKIADDSSLKDKIENSVSESCTKHAAAKADTDIEGGINLLRSGYKIVANEKIKSNLAELLTRQGIEIVVEVQQEFEKKHSATKSMISKAEKGIAKLREANGLGAQKAAEQLDAAVTFLDVLRQAAVAGKHQKKLETALENQDWDTAIEILSALRNEVSGEARSQIEQNLAVCYMNRAGMRMAGVQKEFEKEHSATKSMIEKVRKSVADLREAKKLGSEDAAEQLPSAEQFLDFLVNAPKASKHQKRLETALKNQDWDTAIDTLSDMRYEVSGSARDQIEKNLAVCYLNRAGKRMEVIQREMSSSSPDLWTLKRTLQDILGDLGEAKKLDPYNAEVDNFLNSIANSPLAQILTMDDVSGYSISSQPTSSYGYSSYNDAFEKVKGWLLLGATWLGMAIIIFGLLYLSTFWNPDFNPDDILRNSLTALGASAFIVLMYKLNS